jgi:hypothetical protein
MYFFKLVPRAFIFSFYIVLLIAYPKAIFGYETQVCEQIFKTNKQTDNITLKLKYKEYCMACHGWVIQSNMMLYQHERLKSAKNMNLKPLAMLDEWYRPDGTHMKVSFLKEEFGDNKESPVAKVITQIYQIISKLYKN